MKSKTFVVLLVAIFALAITSLTNVSALSDFADITSVEVNDVEMLYSSDNFVGTAGETLEVRVTFEASNDSTDVRVKADLSGARDYSAVTERFDVIAGNIYTKYMTVTMPSNIDPDEPIDLSIIVEGRNAGMSEIAVIPLTAQRESYTVEILDVIANSRVSAGETLSLDVVLKNRGRHLAEDTFVKVRIPALGIEERAYFGDMSAVDQSEPSEKEDATEKRVLLEIPSNTKAGVYTVEIEAYNADSTTTVTKKIAVVGSSEENTVVSPTKSRTFNVGETAVYSLTLVNAGNKVKVYQVSVDAPSGLIVNADAPVIAIPAGMSETVKLEATASKAGVYDFTATILSNGATVSTESFIANVERGTASTGIGGNTAVLLTVVLAIIFVVLLVVLIVLLTRKPEKQREIGESYY